MKHNGNLKVSGKIASKKIIIGDFSGTTVTSGSYELPYPIGNYKEHLAVSLDISGNKVLTFEVLDANSLSYTPAIPADWSPVPTTVNSALDILSYGLKTHVHAAISLTTTVLDNTYVLQPNGLGGVQWNPMSAVGLTNYYTKAQTNAISGYLQAEIDALSVEVATISANLGAQTFTGLTDAPSSYVGHADEFVTVDPSETKLVYTALLSGSIGCNTVDQVYTVNHSRITINSLPLVSLTLPVSGETQYLASPTNVRATAFDVVLSGVPTVSGYKINWFSLNNI